MDCRKDGSRAPLPMTCQAFAGVVCCLNKITRRGAYLRVSSFEGQDLLSTLLNSLPLFHFSSLCRHGPTSCVAGCSLCFFLFVWCWQSSCLPCEEWREQTLPVNDLFVHLPVQLSACPKAIGLQGFEKGRSEEWLGHRPRKEGAEDNPLLAGGVYSKEAEYDNRPQMPFFCTSRGAVCAGSAQVTLFELRWSYCAGCIPTATESPQNNQNHPNTTNKGECIYIFFTELLLLARCCLCCTRIFASVFVVKGAAP